MGVTQDCKELESKGKGLNHCNSPPIHKSECSHSLDILTHGWNMISHEQHQMTSSQLRELHELPNELMPQH